MVVQQQQLLLLVPKSVWEASSWFQLQCYMAAGFLWQGCICFSIFCLCLLRSSDCLGKELLVLQELGLFKAHMLMPASSRHLSTQICHEYVVMVHQALHHCEVTNGGDPNAAAQSLIKLVV